MLRTGLGISAILFAAMAGSAAAADLPEGPSPVAVAAGTNWSGLYIGLKGSYNWAQATGTVYAPSFLGGAHPLLENKPNGAEIGGEIGYNFQVPGSAFVAGVFADFQTGGFSGSASSAGSLGPFDYTTTGETKLNNLGTVQARIGYSVGRWLPFISGGYAFGQGEHSTTITSNDIPINATYSAKKNYNGWVAGLGTEYAINQHWSLKGEYRYSDLGSETLDLGGVSTKVKLINQAVDFGVNYRF
jgi:outer membrane immunogenic protein